MAPFRNDPQEWQRLDWNIFQNGPVALYYEHEVLERDLAWLRDHEYTIDEFKCDDWVSQEAFHDSVAKTLRFPDYYGHNFNALRDCLSDVQVPASGGVCFAFWRYDVFADAEPEAAQLFLDVLADSSRGALLTGGRLLALVQSNNPRHSFQPVGSCPVGWNPSEWLDSKRGL